MEKDESHAGKVIHRTWYDKNKHIFPASRWEQWDPPATTASTKSTAARRIEVAGERTKAEGNLED